MKQLARSSWRLRAVAGVIVVLWLILIGRLFYVQAVEGSNYLAKANTQQSRKFEIPAARGLIYVHDNDQLYPVALNNEVYKVAIDPSFVKDQQKTADTLAQQLNMPAKDIMAKLQTESRYVELQKAVDSEVAKKIKQSSLPGVILQQRSSRYYPEGNNFSHVLGYVNDDGDGQYGFEQYSNGELAGVNGQYKTTTDALGVPINNAENTLVEPKNGQGYVLTIDRATQALAAATLKDAVQTNKAESGSIIVMDPNNGAIKALVNYPDFDPNNFRAVTDYSVLANRAVSSVFEPGSGFKVITMAAGVDAGKVTPTTQYNDTGELTISGKTIKNAEDHKFGIQTMTDVIQKSLNTGVVFVLRQLGTDPNNITLAGKQALHDYIEKFGFGKVTGIEQAGEVAGNVKDPKAADIDYANMSFGQGISVNSIQLIAAVGAIANGGTLYQPHIVDGVIKDGKEQVIAPKVVRQNVISSQAAAQVAGMMTQVVQHGSGYLAKMPGYTIAGKTGTAQVPRADGKGYEANKNIGSFVGFAPVGDPKFVILVRIDYPHVDGFAEKTAVPAFAVMEKQLFQTYQVPPGGNQP